jgi:hypothetical protein
MTGTTGHRPGHNRCRERSEATGQIHPDITGRTQQTGPLQPARNRGDYLTDALGLG